MSGIPRPRTVDQIDAELDITHRLLAHACDQLHVGAAERAWRHLDELLDERLTITGRSDARTT